MRIDLPHKYTYVIGDIHGQYDLLVKALEWIDSQPKGNIIQLGDMIDRGPKSKEVVELLMSRTDIHVLMGNHESMMIDAVIDTADLYIFVGNGGDTTIESFGYESDIEFSDNFRRDRRDVYSWLRNRHLHIESQGHYYVHAGFFPGISPDSATDDMKLWIRNDFLGTDYDFGKHVVHGHTPTESLWEDVPYSTEFRTNMDMGAAFVGRPRIGVGVFDEEAGGGLVNFMLFKGD